MPITMVNPFTIPEDVEDEFFRCWRQDADRLARCPGFIETRMHRNRGSKDRTYLYVNVAIWSDENAYAAAFKDFTLATHGVPGVEANPGLYDLVVQMTES